MNVRSQLSIMQIRLFGMFFSGVACILLCSLFNGCTERIIEVKWQNKQPTEVAITPLLKVYIENSGSMDGYMCDGAELKDAVYGYISSLSSYTDSTELNYINSQIIPYKEELRTFIRDLTPSSFHRAGGNTSNSDIADMLEKILAKAGKNDVSIFISDCILDVPGGDASNFFVNRQIDIQNVFIKQLRRCKDLGVEIIRLESKFNGWYYYTHNRVHLKDVKRPYYMWIIGSKNILSQLNRNVPLFEIQHGIKDYFAYSTPSEIPFEITNKSGIGGKNSSECNLDSDGKYRILLKANMDATLQTDDILCGVENYNILNSSVNVEKVEKISSVNSLFTHLITITVKKDGLKSVGEKLSLNSIKKPDWLESANDDIGNDVTKNLDKTTGIRYIIEGVANAYKNYRELAEMRFIISKK